MIMKGTKPERSKSFLLHSHGDGIWMRNWLSVIFQRGLSGQTFTSFSHFLLFLTVKDKTPVGECVIVNPHSQFGKIF